MPWKSMLMGWKGICMREENEVMRRLRSMMADRLRKRMREFLERAPDNCVFNTRFRVRGQGKIGFCQNREVLEARNAKVFVCNDKEMAGSCSCFECRNTDETVRQTFDEIVRDPVRCGDEYPKLAMLIWFLQRFEPQSRISRLSRSLLDLWRSLWRLLLFRWW